MKYGRLVFSRCYVSPTVCNAGDVIQTFAVDYIYQKMGICEQDIVEIAMEELPTYRGEKVILPLDGYFQYSREYPAFPTSPDIIPIFLGIYSTSRQYLKPGTFWKENGPVGCRDEATFKAMQKKGYDAYLTGCMTALLPCRAAAPKNGKIFLVDAHASILKYIPQSMRSRMIKITHDIPTDPHLDSGEAVILMRKRAKEICTMYWEQAELVITSRLHCAAPCIAMGIPTIVVKDGYDERFSWLDKLTHLYTPDEYEHINWSPSAVKYESHKEDLFRVAESMIRRKPNYEALKRVHAYYMDRERKEISPSLMVQGYIWLAQYLPGLASLIREKVLYRFTIASQGEAGKEGPFSHK